MRFNALRVRPHPNVLASAVVDGLDALGNATVNIRLVGVDLRTYLRSANHEIMGDLPGDVAGSHFGMDVARSALIKNYWLTVRRDWRPHAPDDINLTTRRLVGQHAPIDDLPKGPRQVRPGYQTASNLHLREYLATAGRLRPFRCTLHATLLLCDARPDGAVILRFTTSRRSTSCSRRKVSSYMRDASSSISARACSEADATSSSTVEPPLPPFIG